MIGAFLTVLEAVEKLLKGIDAYLVKPSEKNREDLSKYVTNLENARDNFRLAINRAEHQLEQGDVEPLKAQFREYHSPLDQRLLEIIRWARQIAQHARLEEWRRKRMSAELRASALDIEKRSETLLTLWEKFGIAITNEQPRHIRNFLRYLCDQCDQLIIRALQIADDLIGRFPHIFPLVKCTSSDRIPIRGIEDMEDILGAASLKDHLPRDK